MSRIGKLPIIIPQGVTVSVKDKQVIVSGPKGNLEMALPSRIKVDVKDDQAIVSRTGEDKSTKAAHGTIRSRIANMVQGVITPFQKELEIRGTGYKMSLSGNKLVVNAGYIHPVEVVAPEGIVFTVPEESRVIVSGPDKVVVGQVASNIRKIRKPEPYKGKGIRYVNEFIKLKAGKTAKV